MKLDHTPWDEKYRPQTIDQIILPKDIRKIAKGWVSSGTIPSGVLFTGTSGIGKTTLARALAHELGADFMYINASLENGIDTIRYKISQFASTVSFSDSRKITLLDEADGLSTKAQESLRGFVEEFSNNHTIIFTCNYISKLIPALHSRSMILNFKVPADERKEMGVQMVKRTYAILDKEGVQYDKQAVLELVRKKFPDFRSVLIALDSYSRSGAIDAGVLFNLDEAAFIELIEAIKAKKFNDVRKWVAEHPDIESHDLFRTFYDMSKEKVQDRGIPELIMTLADFQHRAAFVADQEINTMAFLTSVMLSDSIQWK